MLVNLKTPTKAAGEACFGQHVENSSGHIKLPPLAAGLAVISRDVDDASGHGVPSQRRGTSEHKLQARFSTVGKCERCCEKIHKTGASPHPPYPSTTMTKTTESQNQNLKKGQAQKTGQSL